MHSPDLTLDNVAKIRALFPDCVTEATGEDGKPRVSVDFDQLRQVLSDHIVEGPQERYRLDWPGKREALLAANAPIAKTLRPARDDSVNFDATQNLFIEGDNLEALKLLQESYLGKIKMIYIDPPYNTGGDFIYKDNFSQTTSEFLIRSNQTDEGGMKLVANTDGNGRFHSDWLTMMYSRLKLSRNLLSDDGLIFVSIDANELDNLKKICDEIFGEVCHKNTIAVRRGIKNVQAQFEDVVSLSQGHEYVLLYSKRNDVRLPKLIWRDGGDKPGKWDTFWRGTDRHTMRYELFGKTPETGQWRWEKERAREAAENYEHYLREVADKMSLDEWFVDNLAATNRKLNFVRKNEDGVVQYYVPPSEGKLLSDNWMDLTLSGSETEYFDTEKSVGLLLRAVGWVTPSGEDCIVLDFFAGSATTAHAVMAQNAIDGGKRRFIMVQWPEKLEEGSEPVKAGFKTIADISKDRIRQAGAKILDTGSHEDWNGDTGFRVMKIDTSNMNDVFYRPDEVKQDELFGQVESVKSDRSGEDLLFQVLIDWGVEVTLPIAREVLHSKTLYCVDGNALIACFETGISEELIKDIAARKPLRAVFRDTSFAEDADRINAEQLFRQLSPGTDVRAI